MILKSECSREWVFGVKELFTLRHNARGERPRMQSVTNFANRQLFETVAACSWFGKENLF